MILLSASTINIQSFSAPESWGWLIQMFIIVLALLLANLLRRKIPVLNRSLIPTALIAGLLILLFKAIPAINDFINKPAMETFTYHTLGLGFIALALKNNKIESRSSGMVVTETGCVTATTYIVQGIIGLLCTIPLFLWWNHSTFFYSSGLLLPMGYGQGPGQALNFGKVFAGHATEQGITFAGADFGLAIAAIGFIVGSLVGVIYMNILRKKGKLRVKQGSHNDIYTLQDYQDENEIPHAESVDKLTIQVSLVLLVYALVFMLMWGIERTPMGDFGTKTLKPMIWGFNFLWGTLFGVLIKWVINRSRKHHIIHREYINNYLLNRIAGFCFDVMIVAGTAAISFESLKGLWMPLIVVCTLGALGTFWFVRIASRHLYPGYEYEGFFSMFGMLTGTISNGMVLLREIDPKFETPASNNLVLQSLTAILFGFPVLLLVGFAPSSMHATYITLAILVGVFIVFSGFIFRKKLFRSKKKEQ